MRRRRARVARARGGGGAGAVAVLLGAAAAAAAAAGARGTGGCGDAGGAWAGSAAKECTAALGGGGVAGGRLGADRCCRALMASRSCHCDKDFALALGREAWRDLQDFWPAVCTGDMKEGKDSGGTVQSLQDIRACGAWEAVAAVEEKSEDFGGGITPFQAAPVPPSALLTCQVLGWGVRVTPSSCSAPRGFYEGKCQGTGSPASGESGSFTRVSRRAVDEGNTPCAAAGSRLCTVDEVSTLRDLFQSNLDTESPCGLDEVWTKSPCGGDGAGLQLFSLARRQTGCSSASYTSRTEGVLCCADFGEGENWSEPELVEEPPLEEPTGAQPVPVQTQPTVPESTVRPEKPPERGGVEEDLAGENPFPEAGLPEGVTEEEEALNEAEGSPESPGGEGGEPEEDQIPAEGLLEPAVENIPDGIEGAAGDVAEGGPFPATGLPGMGSQDGPEEEGAEEGDEPGGDPFPAEGLLEPAVEEIPDGIEGAAGDVGEGGPFPATGLPGMGSQDGPEEEGAEEGDEPGEDPFPAEGLPSPSVDADETEEGHSPEEGLSDAISEQESGEGGWDGSGSVVGEGVTDFKDLEGLLALPTLSLVSAAALELGLDYSLADAVAEGSTFFLPNDAAVQRLLARFDPSAVKNLADVPGVKFVLAYHVGQGSLALGDYGGSGGIKGTDAAEILRTDYLRPESMLSSRGTPLELAVGTVNDALIVSPELTVGPDGPSKAYLIDEVLLPPGYHSSLMLAR